MPYAALRNMSLTYRERNPDRRIQAGLRTDSADCRQSTSRTLPMPGTVVTSGTRLITVAGAVLESLARTHQTSR